MHSMHSKYTFTTVAQRMPKSLDSHRLGEISWEVNVQALRDSKPIGHELQGNDVDETLQHVDSRRDHDTLGLICWELWVVGIADDDGSAGAGND